MFNKKAFTLTELLVALAIIGAIAALSIPSLIENLNRRIMITNFKNITASIQQAINDDQTSRLSKDLKDSPSFNDPYAVKWQAKMNVAKTCSSHKITPEDGSDPYMSRDGNCWAVDANGQANYRTINGGNFGNDLPNNAVVVKGGATIGYVPFPGFNDAGTGAAQFTIDVNGPDEPNIVGRDLFRFYVTQKGIFAPSGAGDVSENLEKAVEGCKNGVPARCYEALVMSSWDIGVIDK